MYAVVLTTAYKLDPLHLMVQINAKICVLLR